MVLLFQAFTVSLKPNGSPKVPLCYTNQVLKKSKFWITYKKYRVENNWASKYLSREIYLSSPFLLSFLEMTITLFITFIVLNWSIPMNTWRPNYSLVIITCFLTFSFTFNNKEFEVLFICFLFLRIGELPIQKEGNMFTLENKLFLWHN